MPKADKQPWMKFYPTDWRGDPKLRACGLAARGFWIECIGVMHEAVPYGHLLLNGQPVTDVQLAAMAGTDASTVATLIVELETTGVLSRTRDGTIYSRRMTRDAKKAAIARKNGKTGGNPSLGKDKEKPASDNPQDKPPDKPHIPDARIKKVLKPSSDSAREDDIGCDLPPENQDGMAPFVRPPSDRRGGGARTVGDHLDRFVRKTGPVEKRLKPPRKADVEMANHLMTREGKNTEEAWRMVIAARTEDDPDQLVCARYLEKLSRQHRLGWFAEETV